MIKKAFTTEKEISQFKKDFNSGQLTTKVIFNLIQPYYRNKYSECKDYFDFWHHENINKINSICMLERLIIAFTKKACEDKFGKYDFKYKFNQKYENYIFEFDGLLFIGPEQTEVIIDEGIGEIDLIKKVTSYKNAYSQIVIDYIAKNLDNLNPNDQHYFEELKTDGLIDENNKINFDFYKNKNLNLQSIKPKITN